MKTMSKSNIEGLPDDVLLRILSFVSTRQAVQMSLLLKRWRHLWTCIPVLDFNVNEFPDLHTNKPTAFRNFTDRVLFLRREDESIRKFHLKTYGYEDGIHVRKWVIDVARHINVEELVIEIVGIPGIIETDLLHCLSSCRSLRVLKLNVMINCGLKLPNELNLYGLKSLHLLHITFEGGSLGKLISSCHSLEDLYLGCCQFDNLIITGNNLKKLSIRGCGESKIKVSVPSLQSFMYWPRVRQYCSLDNLVSLDEADICIFDSWCPSDGMIIICKILQGIRYASSLTMGFYNNQCLHLLQKLVECLPMFSNLTHLELSIMLSKDHVEAIINILERSPNLKTLILNTWEQSCSLMSKQEDNSWTPRNVSPSFSPHLTQIKINYLKESALQREFVKFLLENARSVREFTIYNAILKNKSNLIVP